MGTSARTDNLGVPGTGTSTRTGNWNRAGGTEERGNSEGSKGGIG